MKFKSTVETNTFLKLTDGECVTGVFRGEPYEFRQHFVDGKGVLCAEPCEYCNNGEKSSFRFRLNFVNLNDYSVKIFEQGKNAYKDLKAIDGVHAPLEQTMVSISRTGQALSTRYAVTALSPLSHEQTEKAQQCFLHRLEHKDPNTPYIPCPLAAKDKVETCEDIPF